MKKSYGNIEAMASAGDLSDPSVIDLSANVDNFLTYALVADSKGIL